MKKQINIFKEYIKSFYYNKGIYSDFFNNNLSLGEIDKAIDMYVLYLLETREFNGVANGGDSIDREIVRDIMLHNRDNSENYEYQPLINKMIKLGILEIEINY